MSLNFQSSSLFSEILVLRHFTYIHAIQLQPNSKLPHSVAICLDCHSVSSNHFTQFLHTEVKDALRWYLFRVFTQER